MAINVAGQVNNFKRLNRKVNILLVISFLTLLLELIHLLK